MLMLTCMAVLLLSCGGNTAENSCKLIGLTVAPSHGIADHLATAPGNQVQFSVAPKVPTGCTVNFLLPIVTWSTSDPVNTTIDIPPGSYGLGTCVNRTQDPATITATLPDGSLSGTATLLCK